LGTAWRRVVAEVWRRSRVSEMVVAGEAVRAAIRDSIAAMGGVRSGSDESREVYFCTMSNPELFEDMVGRRVPVVIRVIDG
jgi:hypothetical protein